jgi:hypothetical protein
MVFLFAIIIGLCFGGADQYFGSLSAIQWLVETSLLSAPWLVLPFVFGCTQRSSKRAVVIGCVATYAALIGYFVMTLTPAEGVHLHGSVAPVLALLRSEKLTIVGGAVTGPLYGFLGYRWRTSRAWISAVLVGGMISLEPLAAAAAGRLPEFPQVWVAELAAGLLVSGYFVWKGIHYRNANGLELSERW